MSELLGLGYQLFIDNWYTSFEITSFSLQNNTDCTGTLHKDRKGLPKDVSKQNAKLKVCVHIVRFESKTGIMFICWKDKKDVYIHDEFVC